jgi:serine/threonine protein kinase
MIREDNGGRLNHTTNKKFNVDRSCKSIRKEGDVDPPEVGLVKYLDHICIPKIIEIYRDHRNVHTVRNAVLGPILPEYSATYENGIVDESQVQAIVAQLFGCLAYMHERGLVMRAIRPENIIIVETQLGED